MDPVAQRMLWMTLIDGACPLSLPAFLHVLGVPQYVLFASHTYARLRGACTLGKAPAMKAAVCCSQREYFNADSFVPQNLSGPGA
jgi:hypothetical protein